jgi:hypothetical protein
MAVTTAADVSAVDLMTVQEKLLLSQAIYKLGAANWAGVSKLLLEHPCCVARPAELFSIEVCISDTVSICLAYKLGLRKELRRLDDFHRSECVSRLMSSC